MTVVSTRTRTELRNSLTKLPDESTVLAYPAANKKSSTLHTTGPQRPYLLNFHGLPLMTLRHTITSQESAKPL